MTEFVSGFGRFHSNESGAKNPKPYTSIGWPQIIEMVDRPQDADKGQAQWLIPSTLMTRNHSQQAENGAFWMLWADIDQDPPPVSELAASLELGILNGARFEIYTSKSATVDLQKCRILVPLDKPLGGADWRLCQTIFNNSLEEMGIKPDPANEGAGQILFLPNRGEFYATASNRTGPTFEPLGEWAGSIGKLRAEKREQAAKREAQKQAAVERRAAITEESAGRNLIDAFNDMVDVGEVLQRAGYDQDGDRFRHPKSESGSFSASVQDGRVHSLSGNDPLFTGGSGGGAHDAFSAFEILFANSDRAEALKLAGDQWLTIGGVAWNAAKRREYAREKAQNGALEGFEVLPDPEGQKKRFALLTASELRALPPVKWMVQGVVPQSGIGALYGPPSAGKSFVVLDLLGAISRGRDWFGHTTKQTPVAYLALEGEGGIAQRVKAFESVNGPLTDNFRAMMSGLDIRKAADRDGLVDAIRGAGLAGGLIVVDTFAMSVPGMDENDSSAMGLAIASLKSIQRELGGVVMVAHHTGKDSSKGLRGHSSLLAALDFSIEIQNANDGRAWKIGKAKDGRDDVYHPFELQTVQLGADDDLNPIESCVVVASDREAAPANRPKPSGGNQKIVYDALEEIFTAMVEGGMVGHPRIPLDDAVSRIAGKLPCEANRRKERTQQAISGLVSKGLIIAADGDLLQC